MNCLLDTCALLWLVNGDPRLTPRARRAINTEKARVFVSVVSAAELSIKAGKGRLSLPKPVDQWMGEVARLHHLTLLPLELGPTAASGTLPWLHSDPFDRILVATALSLSLPVVTVDPLIAAYPGITVIW